MLRVSCFQYPRKEAPSLYFRDVGVDGVGGGEWMDNKVWSLRTGTQLRCKERNEMGRDGTTERARRESLRSGGEWGRPTLSLSRAPPGDAGS